jgi:uncharacterized protein (TIGR00297 family)
MAMAAFALLLRSLTWWQAAALAATALLFNLFALPRLGGRSIYRASDQLRGYPTGILFYPIAILLLILLFPRRLDIVAAAWGILAVGDGSATLVGRAVRSPRLPWNPEKSVAGAAALAIAGGCAGIFLAWWTRSSISPMPPMLFVILAPVLAGLAAAAVESIPVRLDDNLTVPATAAAVLWACSLVTVDQSAAAVSVLSGTIVPATLVNGAFAVAALKARAVRWSGAVAGALIGTIIYASVGLAGWVLLLVAFLAASVSSRVGLRRKAVLGIAEERGGRRGSGNVIANCGIAAAAAILALLSPYRDAALLAFVSALVAGGSDTVASEIGKAWGRHTFLITGFARVPPGTSGAMSLEGTAAGLAGAFCLAAVGVAGSLIPASLIWVAVAGATVGSLVESVLGATLEKRGFLNNDMLNFINTGIAAFIAVVLVRLGAS